MDHEPAYLAGFLDGEGYIGIHKSGDRYSLRVSVTQLDPRPLIGFQRIYGGNLHRAPDRRGFRSLVVWTIVGHRAAEMLLLIRPWMIVKADQADVALEFQARIENPARDRAVELAERERLFGRISLLKQQNYDHIALPVLEPPVQDHKGRRLGWAKPKPPKKTRQKVATPIRSTGYDRSKRPSAEVLAQLYAEQGLSNAARGIGVSRQTIINWLKADGTPLRGRTEASEERRRAALKAVWR